MLSMFYPTVLRKVQCPECETVKVNPITALNYEQTIYKAALAPNSLNVLFHCSDCGIVFVDYFNTNVEKKRRKLFSLIEELDKETEPNNAIIG